MNNRRSEESVETIHPLYERLRGVSRLSATPEGSIVQKMEILPQGEGESLKIFVELERAHVAIVHLQPNGTLLKGGLTTQEQYNEVRRLLDDLDGLLPPAGPLPETIFIPRVAFKEDTRDPPLEEGGGRRSGGTDRSIESTRTELLAADQVVARFEFQRKKGAFAGYICVVKPHGILLEHPQKQLAAFKFKVPDLLVSLGIDPSRALSPDDLERLSQHIRNVIIPPGTTKKQFVEMGAERICHIGDWQQQVRSALYDLMKA